MAEQFVRAMYANELLMDLLQVDQEVRIYGPGSLGQGEDSEGNPPYPSFPFLMWNELPSSPHRAVEEVSNAQHRYFTFYVYDHMGSTARINRILMLVRDELKDLAPFDTSDEGRCIESRWLGFSGFIPDPEYHSAVRFGTARLQASQ